MNGSKWREDALRLHFPLLVSLAVGVLLAVWLTISTPLFQSLGTVSTGPGPWVLNGLFVVLVSGLVYALVRYNNRRIVWRLESWRYRAEKLWDAWDRLEDAPSPMLLYIKDEDGRYLRVNHAFEEVFGKAGTEIVGKTDRELYPQDIADALRRNDVAAMSQRRLTGMEDWCPVGVELHPFYTIRVPLLDHKHRARAFFAIAADTFPMRKVEEELRARENLLRLIVDNAPIAIGTTDLQGNILSANPYCCRLFGYTEDEFKTMNVPQQIHPDDRDSVQALQDRLAAGEIEHFEREVRYARKDGSFLVGYERTGLVRDEVGKPRMLIGLLEDVTEKRAAEEALRKNEEYLRLIFECGPTGVLIVNLDGVIVDANPMWCKMMEYSREQVIGKAVMDFVHADDRPSAIATLDKFRSAQIDTHALKIRALRSDGSVAIGDTRVGVIRDAEHKPSLLISQVQDITEQEQAIAERQRLRHYLQNIIDSMPSMLVGVDTEGRVTQWNATARSNTGIAAEDAIGRKVSDLLPMLESQLAQVREAIANGRPVSSERIPVEQRGEAGFVDVVVYPLMANSSIGAVIRVDDVTSRVRIEEMMVQTEKMLSVGGLAAGMAHEINNPLGAILQGAQNIRRRLSTELEQNREVARQIGVNLDDVQRYAQAREIPSFLGHIQEAGARAAKIVGDMLTFSRRSELHFEPVNPGDLLDTTLRLAASDYDLKKKYDFKHIEIVRDYDPEVVVPCDKTEIEQVILNLLRNAAQAMATEAGTEKAHRITLRTRREAGYAVIEVADNGPGMDEDTRKRVFEPFFTTKEVGVGTGLGLSVSYFIVADQHRGSLSVTSAPGEGASFRIHLPLRQEG